MYAELMYMPCQRWLFADEMPTIRNIWKHFHFRHDDAPMAYAEILMWCRNMPMTCQKHFVMRKWRIFTWNRKHYWLFSAAAFAETSMNISPDRKYFFFIIGAAGFRAVSTDFVKYHRHFICVAMTRARDTCRPLLLLRKAIVSDAITTLMYYDEIREDKDVHYADDYERHYCERMMRHAKDYARYITMMLSDAGNIAWHFRHYVKYAILRHYDIFIDDIE